MVIGSSSYLAIPLPSMARAPTEDFYADTTYGSESLTVHFYSTNVTGDPTSYFGKFEHETSKDWNSHHFGSTVHTFRYPRVYDVVLLYQMRTGVQQIRSRVISWLKSNSVAFATYYFMNVSKWVKNI